MTEPCTRVRDWRDLPLGPCGRSLVDASAGTGKTWTIAVLYLRLLLEQSLSPRQIVVATFTKAAVAELRSRLRARIIQALERCAQGIAAEPASTDTDALLLHTRWHANPAQRATDQVRLVLALAELDAAPILTLHGLCLRILTDHPFAAGSGFQPPRLGDASAVHEEVADDLWRLIHTPAAAGEAFDAEATAVRDRAVVIRAQLGSERGKVVAGLLQPGLEVTDTAPAGELWPEAWAASLRELATRAGTWAKNAILPRLLLELAEVVVSKGWRGSVSRSDLGTLIANARKRTGVLKTAAEDAQIAATLDSVAVRVQALRTGAWAAAQRWLRKQLDQRMHASGQLGFDALLTRVRDGVRVEHAQARPLADALFAAWPAALIDEFQDTDPVQYAIVEAIYQHRDGSPRGRLVLVGDPKQAIYRFRGGDIHTFEKASKGMPAADRLPLRTNYRSSSACVEAINTLYAWMGHRLGAPGSATQVSFEAAESAHDSRTDAAWNGAALTLYRLTAENDLHDALHACADVIAHLLDPVANHRLGERALTAGDLCVLVHAHHQANTLVDLLHRRGVPCVNRGRGNVFKTELAAEVLLLLDAVAHCDRPRRVRAGLATRLLGWTYHDLRALGVDDPRWREQVERFHRWHALWRDSGVLALLTDLAQHIGATQLHYAHGERMLTDLRHIGELLQHHDDGQIGMLGMLDWLREQRDGDDGDEESSEECSQRLESDAACVQVMTAHASKGLEFGMVFLPTLWKHGEVTARGLRVLTGEDGTRRLALDEDATIQVSREEQDERFRLLYVALTRAKHACHLWLPAAPEAPVQASRGKPAATAASNPSASNPGVSKPGASKPGASKPNASNPSASNPREAPLALCAPAIHAAIARQQARDAHIDVVTAPPAFPGRLTLAADASATHQARPMPAPCVLPLPTRHSFSTLARPSRRLDADPGSRAQAESDEDDDVHPLAQDDAPASSRNDPATRTPAPELDGLHAVAGVPFGNALHAILEHRRIGIPLDRQLDLVREQLAACHVSHRDIPPATLAQRVATRLQAVLDADLDGHGLRLAKIPAAHLRVEMAFDYALDGVSLQHLGALCAQAGHPHLIPARSQDLCGVMTGKIDLLFQHDGRVHVLDWKGNRLEPADAPRLESYSRTALDAAMDHAGYSLQALLYALATERYLRQRLGAAYDRGRHLGDCWYLFVRATGLQLADGSPCGVWRHRFDDALLDAMQTGLSMRRSAA